MTRASASGSGFTAPNSPGSIIAVPPTHATASSSPGRTSPIPPCGSPPPALPRSRRGVLVLRVRMELSKVIVHSIRAIRKGEAVTIAYTDLLQLKLARLSELWSKYRFTCGCIRCSDPLNYVDHSLQASSIFFQDTYGNSFTGHAGCHFNMPNVTQTQRMSDFLDNAIQEYLSESDPRSCCKKLENFLVQGIVDMDPSEATQARQDFPLRQLHFLSLSAFTTLASTYRAYSNQLINLQMQSEALVLEAFDLSKADVVYSLMVPLASFWIGAGESLLSVFRSPAWNVRLQKERLLTTYSSPQTLKCCSCSFIGTSEPQCFLS